MGEEVITKWYLHADLDAFFASVEQLDNPEYRGKPVIVGGLPEDRRSVVSTASYEARAFGVHSAMPTFQAYRLCPQGIFVHGRMHRYAELSHQIMNIFRDYSPDVDQMSIDEAFIDLTGTEKLFGPPEETARKIKERVKQETGLTISTGLATTKYLAKIASGLSKPDGFYIIRPGNEESFMLNLPLNKVWGLGPKSLELIKSKGLTSTREIYERDYDTLEFLFGKNMAGFLYNVIRGIEKESFSRETKSHSISAETTFPYDLTDVYLIETELLELAHGVFFRLLKEESFSRTVMVKIRYDDFSTSTVQETSERNILTLDSFFEIIKRLFEKRYQNGRGIRLLGVGFENIVKEEKPYQQDLFSTGNDEKKQAVEKAILKLSKKHPEIKVSKARTLKAVVAAFVLTGLLSGGPLRAEEAETVAAEEAVAAEENTEVAEIEVSQSVENTEVPEPEELSLEDPPTLFDFDINDENHVELTLDGFWEGKYEQGLDFTFGNKTAPAFSFSPPVFKQDVELYTILMLNNHWYFEADFADEFKKNTVAAGYVGEGLVRSARLSNRGITMPSGYSADFFGFSLAGGDNQAPGFSMHLAPPEDKLQADFLLRYDMTSLKSAVFYGMNSISDRKLPLSDFVHGREFRFPVGAENYVNMIQAVYVESSSGSYKDSRGKKYRKLGSEEYLYLTLQNRLIIASDSLNETSQGNRPAILLAFSNSLDAAAIINACGSWNDTNTFFGKLQILFGKKYKLEDFISRLDTQIEGSTALVLQDSIGFSPFMCAQYYDTLSSETSDVSVIYKTTELTKLEFDAVDIPEYYTSLFEDFFYEKHHFVRIVYNEDLPANVDEDTAAAFPFAVICPEAYLNIENSKDLCVLVRSYTPQNELNIGKNAAAGTVQIYKNGILLHNTSYDKNTGVISLGEAVTSIDKITVTWQEDNTENASGAAVLGAGIKAQFLPCLTGDLIFTGRWPLYPGSTKKYISTGDGSRNGFAALSTGVSYERNGFELTEKTAFSVNKENTTDGLIVVNTASPVPQKYYIDQTDSQYTEADSLLENWCAVLELPAATTVDTTATTTRSYTDIRLSQGSLIKNSDTVLVTLKPEITYTCTPSELEQDIDVYLVLGIKKGDEFEGDELEYYPHWKLNGGSGLTLSQNKWQTITLNITPAQQSKLTTGSDARLLVVRRASDKAISGSIKFGAYEPIPRAIYTQSDNTINVQTYSQEYETDKHASVISWNSLEAKNNSGITASSYFEPSDFSSYKTITWDFSAAALQQNLPVTLILDNREAGEEALRLELNGSVLKNYSGDDSYHKLKIETDTQNVYIDDSQLDSSLYSLSINPDAIPSRLLILLGYSQNATIASNGKLYSGIITYEESRLYFNLQNYISAQYTKIGNIVSIGSFPILKDTQLRVSSLQDLSTIKSDAKAKATITGIATQAELSFLKEKLTYAGHELSTDSSVIPVVSALDNYRFNLNSKEINKKNQFGLDFSRLSVPLKLSYETAADDTLKTGKQNAKATLNYVQPIGEYQLGLSSDFSVSQKTGKSLCTQISLAQEQYFEKWAKITQEEFSQGKSDALNRNEDFKTELFGVIPATILTFSPKLSYGLGGKYSNAKETLFTDKENAMLLLPFTFEGIQTGLEISRNAGGTSELEKDCSLVQNGSYYEDADKVLSLQNERTWFYTAVPFYEIFESSLRERVTEEYSSKYELQFSRSLLNSMQDLYIPSAVTFAVTRDIKNQKPEPADVWQLKLVLTNTSINNFGRNSQHQIFNWFLQEEILSRLTGITRIPYNSNGDNILYQLNAYLQIMLYLQEKSIFTSTFDITVANEPVWSLRTLFSWERPSQTSLITSAAYLLFPSSKAIGFEITRKDTFTIEAEKTHQELMQKYVYNHSASVKFKEHYSVNGGIGAGFTNRTEHAQKLSLSLCLGAKAEF